MNIQQSTDLVEVRTLVAAEVFAPGGAEPIIKALTDKVLAVPADISTVSGRKAVASLAYKIARSKTALDEMGKDWAAELKRKAGAIDAERRVIRESLDELQAQVRKPLTDWEDAEKARVAAHEAALAAIVEAPGYGQAETAAELRERMELLLNYPERDWQEFEDKALETIEAEIDRTRKLLAAAETREAERAELDRLRAEQAVREQREREERIAREAAERDARIVAEAAERARIEAETKARAEAEAAERRAREERERVEREKAQAERVAREAEERARQAEADRIAAEERAKAEAEAAARRAEEERIAAINAERKRVADEKEREEREAAAREANKRHRAKINGAARDALVAAGLTAEQATAAITAIAKGDVPNVKITY